MTTAAPPAAVFVHTHAGHATTFQRLWRQHSDSPVIHLVDEDLLARCSAEPGSANTAKRVAETLDNARRLAPAVAVTCVLVGAVAREHSVDADDVIWINDPAAQQALGLDVDELVLLETAPGAGQAFSSSLTYAGGDDVHPVVEHIDDLWPRLAAEETTAYQELASRVEDHCRAGRGVVLTQASMAPAVSLVDPALQPLVVATQIPVVRALVAREREIRQTQPHDHRRHAAPTRRDR